MPQLARFMSSENSKRVKLVSQTEGGTVIEYALIGAILALGLVTGLKTLKYGLTGNIDQISLKIQRVNNDTSGTRMETGRDSPYSYYTNGLLVNQIWIRYDDGSSVLYLTSPDPNSWFKSDSIDFGKDGIRNGETILNQDGSTSTYQYENIRDGVMNVTQSMTSNNSTVSYMQEQINLGNGYYGYRQTMVSSTNSNNWASGYVVYYYGTDANGNNVQNNIGSSYVYQNGKIINYGGDISAYR